MLCQQDKKEELKSPPSSYSPQLDGYNTTARNFPQFKAINALPVMPDLARMGEDGGTQETLMRRKAEYHQSC